MSRVLPGWSVEQAKRLGASAAKLLVYYHPDAANAADQERFVADVAAQCRAADFALFVEPLGFDPVTGGKLAGEARRRCVIETARRLTALGPDILKAEFPYDVSVTDEGAWADACAELDAREPGPVGAAVRRRGRRDVRAAGLGGLPRRGVRRAGGPLRLVAGRHDGGRRARRVARRRGPPPPGAAGAAGGRGRVGRGTPAPTT